MLHGSILTFSCGPHRVQVAVFDDEDDRSEFVKTLQLLGRSCNVDTTINTRPRSCILRDAVTKIKRDHLLTKFFKHAFAEVRK